jgi:Asp-tRNA(Asn)/Glu-tRNA(Gln) amidotransferase A subunit family amidase
VDALLTGPAWRMAEAVRAGTISPRELVTAQIARVEALNPAINAIVVPRFEQALEEAARSERAPDAPLRGVPFTVKECIPVAGLPCTAGSERFADVRPEADAAPVARLREAGAILIGKTNLSELAAHPDSVNPRYGATRNPHAPDRTAGGSSGGEAAALALGLSALGLGSDLGGSVRWPAHACGVVGLRASRGAVPSAEHVPPPVTPGFARWGAIGPLSRCVHDAGLALTLLARPWPERDPDALLGLRFAPEGPPPRVAWFGTDGLQPVAGAIRAAVRRAAGALAAAGHEVVEAAPPDAAAIRAAFDAVLEGEAAALTGGAPLPAGYLGAWTQLRALERRAHAWMAEHPIVVAPVAPVPAFPLGGAFDDVRADGEPLRPGGKLTICTWANVSGLPSIALPAGLDDDGLPVGVQLIGRIGHDRELLAVAATVEAALGPRPVPDEAALR